MGGGFVNIFMTTHFYIDFYMVARDERSMKARSNELPQGAGKQVDADGLGPLVVVSFFQLFNSGRDLLSTTKGAPFRLVQP